MAKLYPFLLIFILSHQALAQCEIHAVTYQDTIVCGECITLYAVGQGQGLEVFQEDFNNGQANGWAYTNQAQFNNPCDPNGVDGTTHIWMGNNSGVPRILETVAYDFTPAAATGVTVCFDLLFAVQTGDAADAPCEGPDEPDEGVFLQYSIDGGANWIDIHYFDPNGGNDASLVNWNNWCFPLPAGAISPNTQIRWFQNNDSGEDYDHWGIDNVIIYFNDPTFQIIWQHDGYLYGPGVAGGPNPTPVCPHQTTTYLVGMSSGNYFCIDSVTVYVRNPTVRLDAGADVEYCPGDCVNLNGQADILVSPAKNPTYFNGEFQTIANAFGSETAIGINITDLNQTTVLPGAITEVCITQLSYFGFQFPNGQSDIGDLDIFLECPDGTRITLVPAGQTQGNNNPLTGGYFNTCFVPAGPPIAGGAAPYTGAWQTAQPFDNLVGCTANGLWQLVVRSNVQLGFGVGTFFGWNITFNDPEISYPANIAWTPTANMTGANTLSPNVCPQAPGEYYLTATDTAGCVAAVDSVSVFLGPNCCIINLNAAITAVTCNGNDGAISLSPPGPNMQFDWSNGATGPSLTGLAPGTYGVTVFDTIQGCTVDSSFTLTGPAAAVATATESPADCGSFGAIYLNINGGVGPFSFQWSNGSTEQNLTNIPGGAYQLTLTDQGNGCTAASAYTLPDTGSTLILEVLTNGDTDCGPACNGYVAITPFNGAMPYNFQWNNGSTSAILSQLCSGTFAVSVSNAAGCTATASVNITESLAPQATASASAIVCSGDSILLFAGPVPAPVGATFAWSGPNGFTSQLQNPVLQNIDASNAGSYTVTVTDASGCSSSASAAVDVVSMSVSIANGAIDSILLGQSLQLSASSPYDPNTNYLWNSGLGDQQLGSSVQVSPALSTIYVVTGEYAGCSSLDSIYIFVPAGTYALPNAFTPNGDNQNDAFYPVVSGNVQVVEFHVYNRWGQELHNALQPWNGAYQNAPQPRDVYIFQVRVKDALGVEQVLNGEVLLLR